MVRIVRAPVAREPNDGTRVGRGLLAAATRRRGGDHPAEPPVVLARVLQALDAHELADGVHLESLDAVCWHTFTMDGGGRLS